MKKIVISILIWGFGISSSALAVAIEDNGTNIWNGATNAIYQLEESDREKIKEYKKLYDYYSSIDREEKANLYLEKINEMLNKTRIW